MEFKTYAFHLTFYQNKYAHSQQEVSNTCSISHTWEMQASTDKIQLVLMIKRVF